MFRYALIHRFFRPAIALLLSGLLAGSGCTAREAAPSSATETVTVPKPEGFLLAELTENAIHRGDLILVNHEIPYRFPEEPSLCRVTEAKNSAYYIRSTDLLLAPAAQEALNALLDEFLSRGGSKTVNLVAQRGDAAAPL